MKELKLFISYTHQDEKYKEQLITHLTTLKRRGIINEWHYRKLISGQEWDMTIKQELIDSDIILLLISSDFLASNYCFDIEIKKAMEKHEQNEAKVIPIIVRPCDWKDLPFSKLQGLPKNAKALSTWKDIDEGYLNIIEGIKATIDNLESIHENNNSTEQSNFITFDYDVIIARLPRGYLLIQDIEYSQNSQWAVTASYYDYEGNWRHSTHYHESYRNRWESPDGQDKQCAKLGIQKGDWNFVNIALYLIIEIRERKESDNLNEIIKNFIGDHVYFDYYKRKEQIPIPTIPENFTHYNKTGEIRDIIEDLRIDSWKNYNINTLHTDFESKRRSVYLLYYDKLEFGHPALTFVKEIIDLYSDTFDLEKLRNWSERLSDSLIDACKYIK